MNQNNQGNQGNPPTSGSGNSWYWYQPIQNVQNNIVLPETENTNPTIEAPDFLVMRDSERFKLLTLLSNWNMVFLYKTCCEALVDVEALKYITSAQCESMLGNFPLGIKIKFIARLKQWRSNMTTFEINNHIIPSFANLLSQ